MKHKHRYTIGRDAAPGTVRLRKGILEYEHEDACGGRPLLLLLEEPGMNVSRLMSLIGLLNGLDYEVARIAMTADIPSRPR